SAWSTSRSPTARQSRAPAQSGRRWSARSQRWRGGAGACCGPRALSLWFGSWPRRRPTRRPARAAGGWSAACGAGPARGGAGRLPLIAFMGGIVGYVGGRPCRDLLIAGLEKLEYRGYDSAGVSVIEDGRVESVRAVGNLSNLREAMKDRDEQGGGVAVAAP